MTEAEWMMSTDPAAMLRHLDTVRVYGRSRSDPSSGVTARKLRLFARACCRAVWHLLTDPRSRRAVEVAERFADGLATEEELAAAHALSCHVPDEWEATLVARSVAGFDPSTFGPGESWRVPPAFQADLLRCVFGNPFRPLPLWRNRGKPGLGPISNFLEDWVTPAALSLARAAYADRDGSALGPLADELEGAGCPAEEGCRYCNGTGLGQLGDGQCGLCKGTGRVPSPLLAHLRQPAEVVCPKCGPDRWQDSLQKVFALSPTCSTCGGTGRLAQPHALPGCWAVDLLLGKE